MLEIPQETHGTTRQRWHSCVSIMHLRNKLSPYPLSYDTRHWFWHYDVIKWKHFPRYWRFVRGLKRSLLDSLHKAQWRRALMFSSMCTWTNGWATIETPMIIDALRSLWRLCNGMHKWTSHYNCLYAFVPYLIFINISYMDIVFTPRRW